FSSRRRHTRSDRDWSSDVCSSDLDGPKTKPVFYAMRKRSFCPKKGHNLSCSDLVSVHFRPSQFRKNQPERYFVLRVTCKLADLRSEERRVGKECRSGRWQDK